MKSWLVFLTLACVPLVRADNVKLLPSALEMPDHIGPLVYSGKPSSWPDKRLGMAYAYSAPGLLLDIYVYDAGEPGIPEGATSPHVCRQFEMAKADVFRGELKNVVLKSEQLARMSLAHDLPLAREAMFDAVIRDVPSVSYLWITGAAGNFIKLRFSVNAKLRPELEDARRAILGAVGDAIRPHLSLLASGTAAPGDAGSQDGKQKNMSVKVNPQNISEIRFGVRYLTSLMVQAQKDTAGLPPCGGPLRPAFDVELAAYRMVSRLIEDDAAGSQYATRISEIAKAGFLEEFVWKFLHQDFWGDAEPKELELDAFQKWSRKHLKDFKALQFGYVEINAVRELPVEPR